MTASGSNQSDHHAPRAASPAVEAVVQHIERICHAVIDGRRAARILTKWVKRFALTEPEFQLLWRLRQTNCKGLDQTTLAEQLALSTAQVSASVERLRGQGWISQLQATGDRRRNLWHLTPDGESFLADMLATADPRHVAHTRSEAVDDSSLNSREAAA